MEDFGDVIHHSTTSGFGWRDRLRILFGHRFTVRSKIYTKEPATVLRSEADGNVHRWPPRNRSGEGLHEDPISFTHPKP